MTLLWRWWSDAKNRWLSVSIIAINVKVDRSRENGEDMLLTENTGEYSSSLRFIITTDSTTPQVWTSRGAGVDDRVIIGCGGGGGGGKGRGWR